MNRIDVPPFDTFLTPLGQLAILKERKNRETKDELKKFSIRVDHPHPPSFLALRLITVPRIIHNDDLHAK